MNKGTTKTSRHPEEAKRVYDEYGRVREIYDEYRRLRKQLGKSPSDLMDIKEMEENLKTLGANLLFDFHFA